MRRRPSVAPRRAITGWGIGPAGTNDWVPAETLFARRAVPDPRPRVAGAAVHDRDAVDTGSSGRRCQARGARDHGVAVVSAPQTRSARAWPKPPRTRLAGRRRVIESVTDRLPTAFGLDAERPSDGSGPPARLAAMAGLRNAHVSLNRKHGRPALAFADLLDWEEGDATDTSV